MPSSPEDCQSWLADLEINFVLQSLKTDNAGVGIKKLRKKSIYEVLLDFQTALLCLITMFPVFCAGIITYFSSAIVKSYEFNSKQAALLNMPGGAVFMLSCVIGMYFVA